MRADGEPEMIGFAVVHRKGRYMSSTDTTPSSTTHHLHKAKLLRHGWPSPPIPCHLWAMKSRPHHCRIVRSS